MKIQPNTRARNAPISVSGDGQRGAHHRPPERHRGKLLTLGADGRKGGRGGRGEAGAKGNREGSGTREVGGKERREGQEEKRESKEGVRNQEATEWEEKGDQQGISMGGEYGKRELACEGEGNIWRRQGGGGDSMG